MWFLWLPFLCSASHLMRSLEFCGDLNGRAIQVAVEIREQVPSLLFNETFDNYLATFLSPFGCTGGVHSQALAKGALLKAVRKSEIDVALVGPGVLAELTELLDFQGSPKLEMLATLRRAEQGSVTDMIAGVLVRRAASHTNLLTWQDLSNHSKTANLVLCAVNNSFAGWYIQNLEARIQLGEVTALDSIFQVQWLQSHDVVLAGLAGGACDVGAVATPTLERNAAAGAHALNNWAVIGSEATTPGFPFLHSTRLYPEWAVIGLHSLDDVVSDLIRIGLVSMNDASAAALQDKHAGFNPPADYTQVSLLHFNLGSANSICPAGYQRQAAGASLCELCPTGSFSDGAQPCRLCHPGTASNVTGAASCGKCALGSWSQAGAKKCLPETAFTYAQDQIASCSQFPNSTLTVGMVAVNGGIELTQQMWTPTFEQTLNAHMNRFGCFFKLEVLSDDADLWAALRTREVDFAFLAGGDVPLFQYSIDSRAVASVVRQYGTRAYTKFGGVMLRRSNDNLDLFTLEDVQNASRTRSLKACAVARESFEGFIVQKYEFFKQGMDAEAIFSDFIWTQRHEDTVHRLMQGDCDVAMPRTYALESLLNDGTYESGDFVTINKLSHAGFNLEVSTPLYHEWTFMALPHVPEEISSNARIPLLATREYETVAIAGGHAGFILPTDEYESEANVWYQLNLMDSGTGVCAPGSTRSSLSLQPCVDCEAGRFNADGFLCRACEPGYFNPGSGSTRCTSCPSGKTTSGFGATSCSDNTEPLESCAHFTNHTLTVGMLATDSGVNETYRLWQPTFVKTLNEHMEKFLCFFKLRVLERDDLMAAVATKSVDLVFGDPLLYSVLARAAGASAFASVVPAYSGKSYTQQGGVMFRRSDKHTQLNSLQHFSEFQVPLKACPVDRFSFDGWVVQQYEFFKKFMDVREVFAEIIFSGSHEGSVHMVMEGFCDVAMVSSQTIHNLVSAGTYPIESFAIINAQTHPGFTQQVSTKLYSTWPIAALPHVAEEVWKQVQVPLLGMQFSPAAATARHAGFVPAGSYEEEANLAYQLNLMDSSTFACAPGFNRKFEELLQPCVKCSAGRSNSNGIGSCRACQPGSYSSIEGAVECSNCGEGTTTHNFGATACVQQSDALVYDPIEECAIFKNHTLKVGVVLESLLDLDKWRPTFEASLNNYFNRYNCFFEMVGLFSEEVPAAVESQTVDLLFCDPGIFTAYSRSGALRVLSSILRIFNGQIAASYGGVMFRHSKRNEDIKSFKDLGDVDRSLKVCTHSQSAYGSWTIQNYELFKLGIKVEDFGSVVITKGTEDSVAKVAAGECDIGLVRTKTLETLIIDGVYAIEDFFVINQQNYSNFFQLVSTDLYPEWPLTALEHVPDAIANVVSIPLLALRDYSTAAMAGSHAGFTTAFDYSPVSKVRFDMALEANGSCGEGAYRTTANSSSSPAFCVPCPAGYFSPDGIGECRPCERGSISAAAGAFKCTLCPFETYTLTSGSSQCVAYEVNVSLNLGAQYTVRSLSGLFGVLCFSCAYMVIKHRNTKLIKASSFVFNVVLILGCSVVCLSTILFSILPGPDNWICAIRWWTPCVGASTIFGALFSKTYRLHMIFRIYETKQKVPHAIRFKDTKVAVMVFCFIGATSFMLGLFFLIDPPFYEKMKYRFEGQNFFTYVDGCHISRVFTPLIFASFTVLLCGQSYLAFRVRKLPTVFNESQLIAWLLYNTVFVGLVGIMVDYMLEDTALTPKMMVRSIAILIGSITPVFVLYAPKFMEIYRNKMNDSKYTTDSGKSGSATHARTHTNIVADRSRAHDPIAKINPPHLRFDLRSEVGPSPHSKKSDVDSTLGQGTNMSRRESILNDSGVGTSDLIDDIVFVPDSEMAGEETFTVDFSNEPWYARAARGTRRSVSVQNEDLNVVVKSTSEGTLPELHPELSSPSVSTFGKGGG